MKETAVYLCDAKRNFNCAQTECYLNGGECRCTLKASEAILDDKKQPMLAPWFLTERVTDHGNE